MKFKSARIKNFRRFTDVTIRGIPETARLIMLAGPNGCGKSSFFDALHVWHGSTSGRGNPWDVAYHVKGLENSYWNDQVEITFHNYNLENLQTNKKSFYIRSAYRNDPEFQIHQLTRTGDLLDEVRTSRMVDNDAAVSGNYQRLISDAIQDAFERGDGSTTLNGFREDVIGEIRDSFCRLFPNMTLNSLGNPLVDGTFRFTKGTSHGFAFINLSGGEKAVFDLILDLVIARRKYDNTVFCIDEPESHMNASLQAELLSVLYDLTPKNCQLMLATHSIGMMRRARDIEAKTPGGVVFLDFGNRDFDQSQVIEPTVPTREFWNRAYDVALDDLAALIAPSRVVICEGHPKVERSAGNHSHDARCYEVIFETEFPETRFVSMGNDREVSGDNRGLAEALRLLVGRLEVVRLIDRDDRSKEEIEEANRQGVRVLSRRNLESYLFDDEVLWALVPADRKDKAKELLVEKEHILANRRTDDPTDDMKPASGQIYVSCKKILGLTQCGNDAKTFMRDTLAPLVKPGMRVYEKLRCDIFGPCLGS